MFGSEYITDNYKILSIGSVIKNPEDSFLITLKLKK